MNVGSNPTLSANWGCLVLMHGNNSYTKELSLNNKQLNAKVINMNVGKTARVINMFNKSYVIAA